MTNRELDSLVAEKVMRWYDSQGNWLAPGNVSENRMDTWRPSTSISDAWMVVEEMRKDDEILDRFIGALTKASTDKWVSQTGSILFLPDLFLLMWKDLSPEAICRAALEAIK